MTPREKNHADIGLIALRHGLTRWDILGRRGDQRERLAAARKCCALHFMGRGKSLSETARIMDRDHTTIRYYLYGKKRICPQAGPQIDYSSACDGADFV